MSMTFVCDFDGTVAPADIGARLVERFTPPGVPELADALSRWRAGSLGHRELTEIECRHLDGDGLRLGRAGLHVLCRILRFSHDNGLGNARRTIPRL